MSCCFGHHNIYDLGGYTLSITKHGVMCLSDGEYEDFPYDEFDDSDIAHLTFLESFKCWSNLGLMVIRKAIGEHFDDIDGIEDDLPFVDYVASDWHYMIHRI